ncbi:MAG: ABC transporter permease [Parasporobacterium sp.]|nr:ABC transporter permease [Parasporobacterium sp.]
MHDNHISKKILNTFVPVLVAFAIGAVIILIAGDNPLTVYGVLFKKSLFNAKGFANTLHYASPMILTGLAIAITFKANIFNMGVEGQMLFGAFFSGIVGAYLPIESSFVMKVLCILTGAVCGMIFALIPALLRAYLHVDEMVVTLTLNYAMAKVLEYLSSSVFRDQGSGYVCTPTIQNSAMFTRFGNNKLTAFFFIALAIFVIMWVIMRKSVLGYEVTAIGRNPKFAEASGMNTRKKIIILMLISGALAGIAGAGYMMSDQFKYSLSFSGSPGLGWDGMLIALLGRHSPVGILVASIFYSVLKTGADNINLYTDIPKEIIAVIQAIMILFLAVKFFNERYGLFKKFGKQKKEVVK